MGFGFGLGLGWVSEVIWLEGGQEGRAIWRVKGEYRCCKSSDRFDRNQWRFPLPIGLPFFFLSFNSLSPLSTERKRKGEMYNVFESINCMGTHEVPLLASFNSALPLSYLFMHLLCYNPLLRSCNGLDTCCTRGGYFVVWI